MSGTVLGISDVETNKTARSHAGEGKMHCVHCGREQQILDVLCLEGKIRLQR